MDIRRFLSFLCFMGVTAIVFAQSLPSSTDLLGSLDAAVLETLEKDGHVFRYDEENSGNLYLPASKQTDLIKSVYESLNPEVMVEALYKVPYADNSTPNVEDTLLSLYDIAHKVSNISGVKYYSERRKKYAVLFTDVYAVSNPGNKKPLSDPLPEDENYSDTLYVRMKENALGWAYYKLEFSLGETELIINMNNESDLGYIVKVVEENDMQIVLQVIPCSDTILIYGFCGVVLQNDDFVNLLMDPYSSFYRRMTAIETWLYNSLHGTEELPPLSEPLP